MTYWLFCGIVKMGHQKTPYYKHISEYDFWPGNMHLLRKGLGMGLGICDWYKLCQESNPSLWCTLADSLVENQSFETDNCIHSGHQQPEESLHLDHRDLDHMDQFLQQLAQQLKLCSIRKLVSLKETKLNLLNGWSLHSVKGSPIYRWRHVHVGIWFKTRHSAFTPHNPGHGFTHLKFWHALVVGHSAFVEHSGLHAIYGSPKYPWMHVQAAAPFRFLQLAFDPHGDGRHGSIFSVVILGGTKYQD